MGSLEKSDFPSNSFTWDIKNVTVSFLLTNFDEFIYSPAFLTNFLLTEWVFFLHPNTSDGHLSIYLQRKIDNGPEIVHINLKDLKVVNLVDFSTVAKQKDIEFAFGKADAFEIAKIPYHQHEITKYAFQPFTDILRLYCCLQPDTTVYNVEAMAELSRNMRSLFENPEFSDTSLFIKKTEFKIHRAIFEARARGLSLYGKRKLDESLRTPIRGIQETALYKLLQFLYSAEINHDSELTDDVLDLPCTAKVMKIPDFERKLFLNAENWRASTALKCKRKAIRWNIDTTKTKIHVQTFTVGVVTWRLKSFSSISSEEEKITFHFTPTQVYTEVDLKIRFVVAMYTYNPSWSAVSKIAYGSIKCTDTCRKSTELCLTVKKDYDTSVTTRGLYPNLFTSVEMCGGTINSESKVMRSLAPGSSNVLALSWDLLQLFQTESRADTTLILKDGRLCVHRAILCARSPVFSRMFNIDMKEKASGEVIIEDFGKSVMTKLLKYMYSAQVVFDDTEEIIQLAYAADKYAVMSLRKECLRYLRNQYDKKFALDIYVAFDFLQCDDLKGHYEAYIRHIFRFRLHDQLQGFKQNFPILYNNIFCRSRSTAVQEQIQGT